MVAGVAAVAVCCLTGTLLLASAAGWSPTALFVYSSMAPSPQASTKPPGCLAVAWLVGITAAWVAARMFGPHNPIAGLAANRRNPDRLPTTTGSEQPLESAG